MKRIVVFLMLFILAVVNSYAQNDCGNVGFEFGNNTGWNGFVGNCTAGPTGSFPTLNFPSTTPTPWTTPQYFLDGTNEFPPARRWEILDATGGNNGFDPIVPMIPVVSPWGGTYSLKLGNSEDGSKAEKLVFDYLVSANNTNFVYQYAVILQNQSGTPHPQNQQPAFRIKITNTATGAIINPTCGVYNVAANQANVGFSVYNAPGSTDPINYRNWSLVSIDLAPFIGQTLTFEFLTNDCTLGGHYGYAYIDASCIPLQLVTSYCSGSPTADVTAPDGYVSYSWTANAPVNYPPPTGPTFAPGNVITTNQTLIVPSYDTTTQYTVSVIPYQGAQCAAQLGYVFSPVPTLTADFEFLAFCGNTPAQFTETSLVQNNGSPPNAWHWYFGDGDSSNLQNPTHFYPLVQQDVYYPVMLIVYAGSSCKDTIVDSVLVRSGLSIDTLSANGNGFKNVTCFGANNGQAKFTVAGPPGVQLTYTWVLPDIPSSNTSVVFGIKPNSVTAPNIPLYWFKAYDTVNGCADSIPFTITQPPELIVNVPTNYITTCMGSTGSLQAAAIGGVQPYTFAWDTPTPQSTLLASGIPSGTYSILVTDFNGCEKSASGILIDGSKMTYQMYTKNISCHGFNDGEAGVKLKGGKPPYSFIWNIAGTNPSTDPPGLDTSFRQTLKRTNSFVVVKSDNDCLADTINFSITEPDTLNALITSTNATCDVAKNGAVKVDVVGGVQPYTYLWDTDHDMTLQAVSNLNFGSVNVAITDANNCFYSTSGYVGYDSNFVITKIPDFVYDSQANNNLWATVDKPGNYTYNWNNGDMLSDSTINNPLLHEILFPTSFRIDVVDDNGCSSFDTVFVDAVPQMFFPNAFTPNGDKLNDTLFLRFSNYRISNFALNIFDRWGGKVFTTTDPKFKWDGKNVIGSKESTSGIYNYEISYTDNRKKKQISRGTLSIIR